jgi:hypothetical protein
MKMALIVNVGIDGFKPWSGAVSTWDEIEEANKVSDLEFFLEELYPEGITDTQLNDILWFDYEWLFENLGIIEEEEEDEEE